MKIADKSFNNMLKNKTTVFVESPVHSKKAYQTGQFNSEMFFNQIGFLQLFHTNVMFTSKSEKLT